MHFRMTTSMMNNTYNYNLMGSLNRLNDATQVVMTGRGFSNYSDSPAAATQAFSLRRDLWRNECHKSNTDFTMAKIQTAWTAAGTVVNKLGLEAKEAIVEGMSEPIGVGRVPLGTVLKETADSMGNTLNAKYGEHFAFNGNDGLNAPFAWNETTGNLEFRGVNVNCEKGTEEYDKLNSMLSENEKNYLDIGLGLQTDSTGNIIDSTAFNNSLSGLDLTGFGIDEDGDPKNLISITYRIGEIFEGADPDSGELSEEDYLEAERLMDKFNAALSTATGEYVNIDTKQNFLQANHDRLVDIQDSLNEQISNIEQVEPAEAITNMSYQQYCYNAALSIGTQILGQSLLDYMR